MYLSWLPTSLNSWGAWEVMVLVTAGLGGSGSVTPSVSEWTLDKSVLKLNWELGWCLLWRTKRVKQKLFTSGNHCIYLFGVLWTSMSLWLPERNMLCKVTHNKPVPEYVCLVWQNVCLLETMLPTQTYRNHVPSLLSESKIAFKFFKITRLSHHQQQPKAIHFCFFLSAFWNEKLGMFLKNLRLRLLGNYLTVASERPMKPSGSTRVVLRLTPLDCMTREIFTWVPWGMRIWMLVWGICTLACIQ